MKEGVEGDKKEKVRKGGGYLLISVMKEGMSKRRAVLSMRTGTS